jgi:hypothetical protein
VLRPQERLAALLAGREQALVCEELVLRARGDFDQGRLRHAAVELERAYASALRELPRLRRNDLQGRIEELAGLRPDVELAARTCLGEAPPVNAEGSFEPDRPIEGDALGPEPEEPPLRHALERLEAALRARSAAGVA